MCKLTCLKSHGFDHRWHASLPDQGSNYCFAPGYGDNCLTKNFAQSPAAGRRSHSQTRAEADEKQVRCSRALRNCLVDACFITVGLWKTHAFLKLFLPSQVFMWSCMQVCISPACKADQQFFRLIPGHTEESISRIAALLGGRGAMFKRCILVWRLKFCVCYLHCEIVWWQLQLFSCY